MKTYENLMTRIAERTVDNTRDIRRKNRQRRNQVVDLYGVEYTRDGDGGAPVEFRISISPDMVYIERFQFKLIIQPYVSTVGGGVSATQSTEINIQGTSLATENASGQGAHKHDITPNPHSHDNSPHTHNLIQGITLVNTTASDFRLKIAGIDVTPYLMAQHGGQWIEGEGVYPDTGLAEDDVYDVLQVATDLQAEGKEEEANSLVSPGYKVVQITSGSPFRATLVNYLKFSHLNR